MDKKKVMSKLCYYDLRNPQGIVDDCLDDLDTKDFGNYKKEDCHCDNCFYGRTELAEELLKYVEK